MAVTWDTDPTALTTQTAINNSTEEFLGIIDLSTALLAQIQLKTDNEHATTVTDDIIIAVYATVNNADTEWDDRPFMTFTIKPKTVAMERETFFVWGVRKFRIGVLSSGPTDTYEMGGNYRRRLT